MSVRRRPRARAGGAAALVPAAPWYRLPAVPPPQSRRPVSRAGVRVWALRGIFGSAALGGLLMCADPQREAGGDVALSARETQALRFARIDTTLGVAVAEAQLAALRAQDVALRAFAVQQAARYASLRDELRVLAARLDTVVPAADAPVAVRRHGEQLRALRETHGASFDRAYVQHALGLHRDLLAELDAALRTIEDVELREALRQVRGSFGATLPGGAAGDPPIDE